MHFFDPTLDWPIELLQEEIPDLLYIRSDQPLQLSSRFRYTSRSSLLRSVVPWSEYRSVGAIPSLTLLLLDVAYVQQEQAVMQEIRALLRDLEAIGAKIGRYRKAQPSCSATDSTSFGKSAAIQDCRRLK